MARSVTVMTTCDMCADSSTEAEATVKFAWAGKPRMIDLCPDHLAEMNDAMDPFVAASSPDSGTTSRRSSARKSADGPDPATVRAWAEENGVEVSARGRIPATVMDAYLAAQ